MYLALLGITAAVQSIDLALSPKGRMKVGETTLPPLYEEAQAPKTEGSLLPRWCLDAFDVIFSLRGIGYEFGKGVYIPKDTRPAERSAFLKSTSYTFIKTYLVVDFVIAIIQQLPGIGSTAGGSLFSSSLPSIPRYLFSTFILFFSGAAMSAGFESLYSLGTLIGVGIFGQSPTAWPPLTSNPFAADSIGDFWARRWHQTLRRTFVVMGGIPGGWIAGRLGFVMGVFIASGLFHEFGAYAIGRGMDHRVTLFFTLQGVGVILEELWKRATGYRVGGWGGRIWAYCVMVCLGQMCRKCSSTV